MTVKMPYQCFINGQFTDADDGKTYDTINPTDGSILEMVTAKVPPQSEGQAGRASTAARLPPSS